MPDVEPLGDARWARIEANLMERLDELPTAPRAVATVRPLRRTWPLAAAATFALSAAAAVAVHVARPSLHASTSRVVTESSPSHMTFGENAIDVSPESGILLAEEEHATVLTLERGEVSLHVAPREKDRPFLIEAGDVHVRIVGTELTVKRAGIGATVFVQHGVVEVREHGELATVRTGERWPLAPTSTPTPTPTPTPNATPTPTRLPRSPLLPIPPRSPVTSPPRSSNAATRRAPSASTRISPAAPTPGPRTRSSPPDACRPTAAHARMPRGCSRSTFVASRVVRMPKMRERSASLSGRPARSSFTLRHAFALLALLLASSWAPAARAAARRIALLHAGPELTRSVNLALYPWDIGVVEAADPSPDPDAPDAIARARAVALRHEADAIAWIARTDESATLWFFDAGDVTLHSHAIPTTSETDPAELAAIALTLKTLVRGAPWESRIPTVAREHVTAGWESHAELDVLGRAPTSGASAEPRLGLWVSEWYGTSRWLLGAALGASAGLGMTSDSAAARGTLNDIDVRGSLRARVRFAPRFAIEPRLGMSAHVERASVTTTTPATTGSFTRVDPSFDAGLGLAWLVTESFAWSVGVEALELLSYQRWLQGQSVVFAPSSLLVQAGSSIAWTFR